MRDSEYRAVVRARRNLRKARNHIRHFASADVLANLDYLIRHMESAESAYHRDKRMARAGHAAAAE